MNLDNNNFKKLIEIWQLEYLIDCIDIMLITRSDMKYILNKQKSSWERKIKELKMNTTIS
jgi:hypothetical protein